MSDQLLSEAHRFLDWARDEGADLNGADESVWFVQGVLESMSRDTEEPPSLRGIKCLAYSVYLAELLAATCRDVRMVIDGDGLAVEEVLAGREGGATQFVLSWVLGCLEDPQADNVVFKFAGALKDFGENERAGRLYAQLESYNDLR
ncbi:hypothetical protein ABZ897_26920 [Nonomuraea sp. NPDC046802]|uniref:hypothetical protein n=1 Tax=Nonomuraea sp. NPDC046802 TaxID=3154919 RepID=UPI0033CE1346